MWQRVYEKISFHYIVVISLLTYATLHLIEEGFLGFPAWALKRWGIPNYTTTKWLIHNVYFLTFLIIGYLIYRSNRKKYLIFGLGIVIWGLLNTINHTVFSVIFMEYSPGLFTGLLFSIYALIGFKKLRSEGKLSIKVFLFSLLVGVAYWVLPMICFIEVDRAIGL